MTIDEFYKLTFPVFLKRGDLIVRVKHKYQVKSDVDFLFRGLVYMSGNTRFKVGVGYLFIGKDFYEV